ncbi:MAG TPA: FAD-binding oxidoreductase [Acidimicrobiales bacterium]|nr:FAD-binding oxidoreductase [Acidimicrobiales bacterium]
MGVDDRLAERLAGVTEIDTGSDALYQAGRDWWPLALGWAAALSQPPALPALVARPRTAEEVSGVLACCNEARVPVTPAGGRSGVCGASVPVHGGVALDLTGLSGIRDVDDESLLVTVGAGTFGDDFEDALRSGWGLTVGHWPQSVALSTVGGWVACRSAGQYSTRYGKIEDMVVGLDVVLADGARLTTGSLAPRGATGPDLNAIFVGSEGTLGVVTSAVLRAHPVAPHEARGAWGFPDFAAGLDACRRVLRRGATPAVLRLYDPVESTRSYDTTGQAVLLVLDEGDPAVVEAVMAIVAEECRDAERLDEALVGSWMAHRNDVSALGSLIGRGFVVDTVEVAGRWSVLPGLYTDVVEALRSLDGTMAASAHQSHAYSDGACLYFTFAGRPPQDADPAWAERYYTAAWDRVMTATTAAGAAISHHHGIGLNRGRHLEASLGASFGLLRSLKAALDPNGILNPGKLGLPSPFGEVPWP